MPSKLIREIIPLHKLVYLLQSHKKVHTHTNTPVWITANPKEELKIINCINCLKCDLCFIINLVSAVASMESWQWPNQYLLRVLWCGINRIQGQILQWHHKFIIWLSCQALMEDMAQTVQPQHSALTFIPPTSSLGPQSSRLWAEKGSLCSTGLES